MAQTNDQWFFLWSHWNCSHPLKPIASQRQTSKENDIFAQVACGVKKKVKECLGSHRGLRIQQAISSGGYHSRCEEHIVYLNNPDCVIDWLLILGEHSVKKFFYNCSNDWTGPYYIPFIWMQNNSHAKQKIHNKRFHITQTCVWSCKFKNGAKFYLQPT